MTCNDNDQKSLAVRISVIIPFRNPGALFSPMLKSLQEQTIAEWECLLLDDASSDESRDLVEQLISEDSRFSLAYVSEARQGAPRLRNIGLAQSRGEFVLFADSDDSFPKDALEILSKELVKIEAFDFVAGQTERFYSRSDAAKLVLNVPQMRHGVDRILEGDIPFLVPAAMFRRSFLISKKIAWHPYLIQYQDWHFLLQVFAHEPSWKYISPTSYLWREHMSPNRLSGKSNIRHSLNEILLWCLCLLQLRKLQNLNSYRAKAILARLTETLSKVHPVVKKLVVRGEKLSLWGKLRSIFASLFANGKYLRLNIDAYPFYPRISSPFLFGLTVEHWQMLKRTPPIKGGFKSPVISIVTVTKNNLDGLILTFESLPKEDTSMFEWIIVDSASTDGTSNKVDFFRKRFPNLNFVTLPDNGIYEGMNRGISLSSGKWLLFLNAGDALASTDVLHKFIENDFQSDVVYGDSFFRYPNRDLLLQFPDHLSNEFMCVSNLAHQASFTRASLFQDIGLFDETYRIAGDHDFFVRAYFLGKSFLHWAANVCVFYDGGIGSIPATIGLRRKERIRLLFTNAKTSRQMWYAIRTYCYFFFPKQIRQNKFFLFLVKDLVRIQRARGQAQSFLTIQSGGQIHRLSFGKLKNPQLN